MNEDTVIKLLASTNKDDVMLGIVLLAKLPDPRAFFRSLGKIMDGQCNKGYSKLYTRLGDRYEIDIKVDFDYSFYYKILDDFYIVSSSGNSNRLVECYSNYSDKVKVINHKE